MDRGIGDEELQKKIPFYPIPYHLKIVLLNHLKPWPNMPEKSRLYFERLKELEKNDELKVKHQNYCNDFHILLYEVAFRDELEMEEFNIYQQEITGDNQYNKFKIYVEGLEEERPTVAVNDSIEVTDTETKVVYILRVIRVLKQHIIVESDKRFCNEFSKDRLYDIKFVFNNFPYRCCHYAIDLYVLRSLKSYVFPEKSKRLDNRLSLNNKLVWFNEAIENNKRQKQAVLNIVDKSNSFPAPYILYGPPGTGKTATLVEAICQASKQNPSDRILVCTPSNTSADVVIKRLMKYIPKKNLHRMYSLSKDPLSIDDDILDCCNCLITDEGERKIFFYPVRRIPKIIVATLCTSTRLLLWRFPVTDFPYIFIDEAGQATEPETLIPFSLLSRVKKERKIILAGDPQQLGPVIRSNTARRILGKSMLERLMTLQIYQRYNNAYNPRYITKLVQNYRSHPALIHVSNKLFYNNELIACKDKSLRKAEDWRILPNKQFPILYKGVLNGEEERSTLSPSSYNEHELEEVWYYTRLLIGTKLGNTIIKQEDIGVITPFTAQKIRIREMFEEENLSGIEVGTIQLFQGKEKEIIILSTVRSNIFNDNGRNNIGFLDDPRRFNVGLTRAKSLFIMIGHPETLQTDYNWWYFLDYCCRYGAYVGGYDKFRLKVESEFRRRNLKKNKHNKKKTSNDTNKSIDKRKINNNFLLATKNRYSVLSNETHRLKNTETNKISDNPNSSYKRSYKKNNELDNRIMLSSINDNTNFNNAMIPKLSNAFQKNICNIL